MEWTCILAYIPGSMDQELLLRNEYLAAENCNLGGQAERRLGSRTQNGRRLAKLASDWAVEHRAKWRLPPSPTPFWHDTDGSWLANSTEGRRVLANRSTVTTATVIGN
jgi:hypothetical protein